MDCWVSQRGTICNSIITLSHCQVEHVQEGLKDLQSNISQVEAIQNRILSSIVDAEQNRLRSELDSITDGTSRLAFTLRQRLQKMEEKAATQPRNSANGRMYLSQQNSLARKFRDMVWTYHEIQSKYRERQKGRFERQYRIVNPNASHEEVEKMLESDSSGSQMFAQNVSVFITVCVIITF